MNAAVRFARDVSDVMERVIAIEIGSLTITATVTYRIAYPSLWHRGHGLDCEVEVLEVAHEFDGVIQSLSMMPGLHDKIVDLIEADELEFT